MRRTHAGAVAAAVLVGIALLLLMLRARTPVPVPEAFQPPPANRRETPVSEPQSARPSVRASSPSPPKKVDASQSPFASEDDYLRTLERLNLSDKARALELVEKGEGWYAAAGEKAEARRALGITLLVDLGNMEEARLRTRRFIAEHPSSRYRPIIQGVTGIHPRPTGPSGDTE